MYKLGYHFDFGNDAVPVDLSAAAITGKRINLRNMQSLDIVLFKGAAASGTDPVLTFNQWQSSSGGSAIAYNPAYFWKKSAATLANTEQWAQVTVSTTNGQVTLTGEQGNQGIYVFEINVKDITDGYDYVSVDVAKAGTVAQLGALLYVPADLTVRRGPANMPALLF